MAYPTNMAVVNMQDFPLPSGSIQGPSGPSSSTVYVSSIQRSVVSGAINGNNKVFAVSPSPPTLMWFWNGVLQNEPDDYTYSGGVVTMSLAPAVGDKLAAIGG